MHFTLKPAKQADPLGPAEAEAVTRDAWGTTDAQGRATIVLNSRWPVVLAVTASANNSAGTVVSSWPTIVNFIVNKYPSYPEPGYGRPDYEAPREHYPRYEKYYGYDGREERDDNYNIPSYRRYGGRR